MTVCMCMCVCDSVCVCVWCVCVCGVEERRKARMDYSLPEDNGSNT